MATQNGDLVLHNNDIVVPIMGGLANLFSQEPAELTQQELLDAIASQTAEQLLQFQTPQVSRREENPALVTITPRSGSGAATPVPNTSLNLLRASAAAESGGGDGTDGVEDNEPRSSTSRTRSSTRDAQKSEMEKNGFVALPSDYGDPYIISRRMIEEGRERLALRRPLPLPFPARFLHGTADTDVDLGFAHRLIAHATGPDIRLTIVKGADHRFSTPDCLALIAQSIADVSERIV